MIKGTKKLTIPFTGGLNEADDVDSIALEDSIEMENWRLDETGNRIAKRLGCADQSLTEGEDIYGYSTYYDSTPAFCQLLILESEIKRKVGRARMSATP